MMIFYHAKTRGFIALVSILIMSAILLLLAIGMSSRSLAASQIGSGRGSSDEAKMLAEHCAEHALFRYNNDRAYAGNETLTMEGEMCTVHVLEDDGGGGKFMKTESTVSGYTKWLVIDARPMGTSTMVISWQE